MFSERHFRSNREIASASCFTRLLEPNCCFQVNVRKEIGEVFKIRVGLAEQPDVAQYWTLDSVRLHVVSEQLDVAQNWTLDFM